MKGVHPLSLLTRDDWNHVFARLKPVDRWTIANAHPLFRSIFETERKQEWILTLLALTLPNVCGYLDGTALIKLRLVSRSVQSIVDRLLEDSHKFGGKTPCRSPVPAFCLSKYLEIDPGFDLESLLEQKRAMPEARIVGGSVFWNERSRAAHLLNYRPFFQEFGKGIHMLSLCINHISNPVQYAKLIRRVLQCTPNLKKFWLSSYHSIRRLAETHPFWAEQLQLFWRDSALPALPQLETLDLFNHSRVLMNSTATDFSKPTIEAIFKAYGFQLRDLSLMYHATVLPASMPVLQHLEMTLSTPEDLKSLQTLQAPLQLISVSVLGGCQFAPGQFFQSLETFQGTLTQLSLECQCCTFGHNVNRFLEKVELPLLKKVKVFGFFYGSGLHFLKHFKQVQILDIHVFLPLPSENEHSVGPLEKIWNKREKKMRNTEYGRWIRANYRWDYYDYDGAEIPAKNLIYRWIRNALCCCISGTHE